MMSTLNPQDQSRKSFRERLYQKVNGAFRRAGYSDVDEATLSCQSEYESECSTLIDFVINDSDSHISSEELEEAETGAIHIDNLAWVCTQSASSVVPVTNTPSLAVRLQCPTQTSLLDEEECSWVMPRSKPLTPRRRRFHVFPRKIKTRQLTTGLEPELLEPEERSWM